MYLMLMSVFCGSLNVYFVINVSVLQKSKCVFDVNVSVLRKSKCVFDVNVSVLRKSKCVCC